MVGLTVLVFAVSFSLPPAWQRGRNAMPLLLVMFGALLCAVGAGFTIGRVTLPATNGQRPRVFTPLIPVFFALGLGLFGLACWVRTHARRAKALSDYLAAHGTRVDGVVTSSELTGEVNNAPRFTFVVKYADAQGTTPLRQEARHRVRAAAGGSAGVRRLRPGQAR